MRISEWLPDCLPAHARSQKRSLPSAESMRAQSKQSSGQSFIFAAAVMIGSVAALYFMREVLIPLAFALTLTFLLTPVVSMLERLKLGRLPAATLTLLIVVAVTCWASWNIGTQLVDVASQLPVYRGNIQAKIQALSLSQKGPLGRAAASVKELSMELSRAAPFPAAAAGSDTTPGKRNAAPSPARPPVPVEMVEPASSGWAYIRDLTAQFLRPVALVGVVLIFTIFMLVEREDLRNRLLRLVGVTQLNVMTQALDDAARRVSRYLLMQFLVNAAFGLIIWAGLYAIGLPNAALWGVVAGLLRIVPYAGTLVAAVLPFILSLAVFDTWWPPLLVFLLFAIVEILVGNVVEPWLYGAHTGISSLALLVTTAFWTVLWGPAGLVLSTPLTVCVVVLGRYVPELSFLYIMLGDEPVLADEALLYQRLLAMDQQEARSVVDVFLKTRPLIELYDTVLMPALNMAEQDRHRGAIDVNREEFLFLSINEMIAEFSEIKSESAEATVDETAEPAKPSHTRRIICLPAHDEADAITAAMLAQVLDQQGFVAVSFPLDPQMHETLEVLDIGRDDILCISALPPYAFAPARLMAKHLHSRFPKSTIVACIWGFAGEVSKASARFERGSANHLSTSLGDTVAFVRGLSQ